MKTKRECSHRGIGPTCILIAAAAVVLLCSCSNLQAQQWQTNGNNISNTNTGNVGIGTTTPAEKVVAVGNVLAGNIAAHTQLYSSYDSQSNAILELGYGTATSDIIPFASFVLSKNLTSPNNAIGVISFANSSIADGNEKRTSAIGSWTDGAINSGTLVFYTTNAGTIAERMRINSLGNVGIGTNTPQSNLQIGSQTSTSSASPITLSLGGSYSNSAGGNLKLKLYDDGVLANTYGIGVSAGSMDFGVSSSAAYHWYAGGVNKMTLDNSGNLSVTGNIAAKYQDVAEWVPSSEKLIAGTVVVLDPSKSNQVTSSTTAYDTRVAGVVSAQPGITLGEKSDRKVLVATTGRVRVKVEASKSPIRIGDLLVTSDIPGVAMKSEAVNLGGVQIHRPGTLIGKALEPLAKGQGEILVLLSLQ